jgi:hypothetical protein
LLYRSNQLMKSHLAYALLPFFSHSYPFLLSLTVVYTFDMINAKQQLEHFIVYI